MPVVISIKCIQRGYISLKYTGNKSGMFQGRDGSLIRKAISKLSTEYRLQFAWPQGHTSRRDAAETPRKSQSMGALKAKAQANAMVHRKRIDMENKDGKWDY